MHFKFRNVNDAFTGLVKGIHEGTITTNVMPSRVGEVLMIEEPVIVTYDQPRERVLFNLQRDANPFFHLMEALWMLAGRNDVAVLAEYSSKIVEIQSDDGKTANGAYGHRWRYPNIKSLRDADQLKIIIDQLRRKPESRRVVLQMWNVEDDLLKIDVTKDVCCNLCALFNVEDSKYVNMTVFNRSNDLILGMLGANVVHFSFLQEYIANCLGLEVGRYHQVSNNLHVYTKGWDPDHWLYDLGDVLEYAKSREDQTVHGGMLPSKIPLVKDQSIFDHEVNIFVDNYDQDWLEPFLQNIAKPMMQAFHQHKLRNYDEAARYVHRIAAEDWRAAAHNWITKRQRNWEAKNAESTTRNNESSPPVPAR